MATKADLNLAKRLLAARVLPEANVREAFEQQAELARRGRTYPLARILYARKDLPPGSLDVLDQARPPEVQPFADYELTEILGEGGSSVVYGGIYVPNGAPVAVKILDPVQALRADFLQRFQDEARMLVELEHPHIVQGYEFGHENGWHFFSMERVDGLTVLDVIDRRGHLENQEALSITRQAASALDHLHHAGYLHRDIKPSNMMVESTGHVHLIDLGLVRDLSNPTTGGDETMTVGTVEYVSPEQARGRSDLDPRSDIYSLGLSLYHMAVGEVPFQGESDYEVMAKQIMAGLDTQKLKTRRIAPELHFFITKMTSKDRESRFESVSELEAAVGGYLPAEIVPIDFGPEPAPPVAAPIQAPMAKPVAPVAKPVAPVARPVAKPVAPVAKPVAPVAKPVAPVAKPAAPVAKPVPPVARPAAPVAKPVPPVAKPASPVAKPAAPAAEPAPVKPSAAPADEGSEGKDAAAPAPAKGEAPVPKKKFEAPVPRKRRGDAPVPRRRREKDGDEGRGRRGRRGS